MSDAVTPPAVAAGEGTVTPVVPAAAPVVAATVAPATPPAAVTPPGDPAWLPERIKQAKDAATRDLLRQLGFENPDAAVAAVNDLKKRQDAEKTETQRLTEENAALKVTAAKVTEYESVIRAQAEVELAKIPEAQRLAITELAGADPVKQVKALEKMRAAGMFAPPPVAAAPVTPVVAAPVVPITPVVPSTTAPPAIAPVPTPAGGKSHLAELDALEKQNPQLAAQYRLMNYAAIAAERNARV